MPTKIEWTEETWKKKIPIEDLKNLRTREGEMNKTGIEYLTHTWNPIAMKCTPVSEACDHCWHLGMAKRMAANPKLSQEARDAYTGESGPVLLNSRLDEPMRRKTPSVIGVQFMGDLFHKDVEDEWIADIWNIMLRCPQHTFQILTKRPERMAWWIGLFWGRFGASDNKPPSHIWLGVTAENQEQADKRIPTLLRIPAAVHFVSVEPMLSEIHLRGRWISPYPERFYDTPKYDVHTGKKRFVDKPRPKLDWVICGAETGPGKRPMHLDWARSIRDQCQSSGTPFFFKRNSNGNRELDGRLWEEMPE